MSDQPAGRTPPPNLVFFQNFVLLFILLRFLCGLFLLYKFLLLSKIYLEIPLLFPFFFPSLSFPYATWGVKAEQLIFSILF